MAESKIYALVTGASRGIGKHITQKLLDNGATVIGTKNASDFPELFTNHSNFEPLTVNLADPVEIEQLLKPIFNRDKVPNVLINNAGISKEAGIEQDDEYWLQVWDKTQQINMRAPALISKWAINNWQQNSSGGILINIASRAAYRGDTQEFSAYAASKGGLVAFTKSIARDYGTDNIAAYSIAPGFIKTDMAFDVVDVYGEDYLTQGSAFDEITSPEEVAELVTFLAQGNVKHMTGSTFHINGGSYMI